MNGVSDLDQRYKFGSGSGKSIRILAVPQHCCKETIFGATSYKLIANSIVYSQWIKRTIQYRCPTTSQRSYKFRILRSLLKQCSQTELTRKLKPSRKGGPGIDSLPLHLHHVLPTLSTPNRQINNKFSKKNSLLLGVSKKRSQK